MANPIQAAGAQTDPTRYGALNMGGEQFTGLWTQRSPYRDAATAYLIKKFYQGSRFDSMWDGLNREISAKLTDIRRPGNPEWNSTTFPSILSFYAFKCIQYGQEIIRILADGSDGSIYDATGGGKSTVYSGSGGGPTRFLGVGTTLFFTRSNALKKWIYPGGWGPSKTFNSGNLINEGAAPGTIQMALGGISLQIVATASNGTTVTIWVNPQAVPEQFPNLVGAAVSFSGLTGATYLNTHTYPVASIVSTTLGIFTIALAHTAYAQTADTGTGSTGNGTTGATAPIFSGTQFAVTADAGQQWKCYGTALQNWGLGASSFHGSPLLVSDGARFWQANTVQGQFYSILDPNQNIQVMMNFVPGGTNYKTGLNYPNWTVGQGPYSLTVDGTAVWWNFGPSGVWTASTAFGNASVSGQILVIVDSNQNLQIVTNGGGGNSGGSEPTWATTVGATTSDGALTWTCVGPGVKLTTAAVSYAFSTHSIDGSVSTASLPVTIPGGILGPANTSGLQPYLEILDGFDSDTQIDQIWIWRTAQGQATLILEDQTPTDTLGTSLDYGELGIPDTSTTGGGALNALIPAPVAESNDPPQPGMTAPVFYLQRVWMGLGSTLYYSGGPDTITGNGATAFPPLNEIPLEGNFIRAVPITVENGALLVLTTSGIEIVLGLGTASNPFYATKYCDKVNLANYNALDILGTVIYLMEANAKVSSITIQYPFNPQSGYTEVGFPIGDQFLKVTTGGLNSALYNPATAFLSWCIANTRDTGMYVADGAVGWFRMSSVAPPESGLLWSPRAAVVGGTSAVQSVETSPGIFQLLIGPPVGGGPILARDASGTLWNDNASDRDHPGVFTGGTAYPAWDVKGVNLLCPTGQTTEVVHISAKSAAVGARPAVSILLGEIAASAARPWDPLLQIDQDPPKPVPESVSVYSDRYKTKINGRSLVSDCILTKFDYGTQAAADELMDWGIYATTEDERKEQAAR